MLDRILQGTLILFVLMCAVVFLFFAMYGLHVFVFDVLPKALSHEVIQ